MLEDRSSSGIGKDRAGIGMPVGHPSTNNLRCRTCRVGGLLENSLAVVRMHRGVAVAMENDGRHGRSAIRNRFGPASLPHGDERGGKIAGGPAGETRMNANGRVQIGVRCSHDRGSGPTSRQAYDIYALWFDRI